MAMFNLDGNAKTGQIVFAATDQQHLDDLWVVNSKDGKARQVTHLNPEMEKYVERFLCLFLGVELKAKKAVPTRGASGDNLP